MPLIHKISFIFKMSIKCYFKRRCYHKLPSQDLITKYTTVSQNHLTPEIKLRLITRDTEVWNTPVPPDYTHPLGEPFWAFYWPGGQGISRYILDHSDVVKGKKVLDFGCGSGVIGIAALLRGAKAVVANDIDSLALEAVKLNAQLNGLKNLKLSNENLIGDDCSDFDVVLVGDMMYDSQLAEKIAAWCANLCQNKKTVLIGDPGRCSSESFFSSFSANIHMIAKYELDQTTRLDNYVQRMYALISLHVVEMSQLVKRLPDIHLDAFILQTVCILKINHGPEFQIFNLGFLLSAFALRKPPARCMKYRYVLV